MTKAIWNGAIIAESDDTVVVEGNHYFPSESINHEYVRENSRHSICPWKGMANYYDLEVDGQVNHSAAWYYPSPKWAAQQIENRVAFWRGVSVES